MPIGPGSRVGSYEVTALLGEGGMGKVWRAHHTGLKRDDALKVLPDAFVSDPERLARFRREAQVLASLNHPNIAHVYGLEQSDGVQALVMELVEGPTLADRISRGPIPVEEALVIATQIAEALEAAHEQAIIHRDLKPANIKVRPDGTVKVLDFGLAKALEPAAKMGVDATASPTVPSPAMTQVGTLLGTASYMSPEQAKGLSADHRSDIFSFGSVLYEMLTGRRPFPGDTPADVLASVLAREPDWTALPSPVNPRLSELLRRCLEKSPRRRWQAIGDLRAELESIAGGPGSLPTPAPVPAIRPLWRRALAFLITGAMASAVTTVAMLYVRPSPAPATVTRLSFTLADSDQFNNIQEGALALSPDGTRIAYATPTGLHVRTMSDPDGTVVVNRPVQNPVFSPDGQSILFTMDGGIHRIPATGGTAATLCSAGCSVGLEPNYLEGMSWSADGILVGVGDQGILRLSADGGMPERLITLNTGEWAHGPQKLPATNWVLLTLTAGNTPDNWNAAQVIAISTTSGERKVLVERGKDARYLASGHLVFAQENVLFAAPFDVRRIELLGAAVPVIDGVRRSTISGTVHFSVSDTGSLIYIPGPTGSAGGRVNIVIADRFGATQPLMIPAGPYEYPRVSPDGRRLAFGTAGPDQNIWIYDLAGTTAPGRLTLTGRNRFPIWAADSRRIAFQSDREGDRGIFWQTADGTGTAERLTTPEPGTSHVPESWSPRDDRFLFSVVKDSSSMLWSFSLQDRRSEPFGGITSQNRPIAAAFSPDGQWVVYSRLGSANGVFVEPVPPTGATYQLSAPGFHPWWSRDGQEIFFFTGFGRIDSVRVFTQTGFKFNTAVRLPRGFNEKLGPAIGKNYDVTADGRFIGLAAAGQGQGAAQANQVNVVLNWHEELKRLVPTN